jgi:type IX secretion system PorP/SprF family membrane protein
MQHIKYTFLSFAFMLICSITNGQDIHFSQYYNAPLALNPAMTGLIMEDLRISTNYRNQWSTVTSPYETMAASADFSILKGYLYDDFIGLGLLVMNDRAGDLNFRNTQAQLSLSYSKALNGDGTQYLTAGVQGGIVQQAFDASGLLFDSQYDGSILNSNINSGEVIDRANFFYSDLSAGVAWYYVPSDDYSFYFGIAMAHLNRPNVSFSSNVEDKLLRRTTVHAGMDFPFSESLSFVPQIILVNQGPHTETTVGSLLKFSGHPDYGVDYKQTSIYMGAMFRLNDAIIPMIRFDFNQYSFTASYDVNSSNLSNASRGNGGFEISAVYRQFLFDSPGQNGPVGCPTF